MPDDGSNDQHDCDAQESNPESNTAFPPLADVSFVLTGPTASGKSHLAMEWAEAIGGEILSLDSIAVYRQMDIGSAKPTANDQARIPHHLIDLVAPDEEFSVACYLRAAHRVVAEVRGRGKTPIFVGGTPMFLKGILRGFDPGPPADWDFRHSVEQDLKQHGIETLYQRLQQVDPLAAHRIHPGDSRRMIRALEVAHTTGRPISHQQTHFNQPVAKDLVTAFTLTWQRSDLHQRIEARVEQMFADGLVAEVESLLERYGTFSRTAGQGVGYREVIDHLAGELTLEQCQEQVLFHTRRLARRQETWFRSFGEIQRISMNDSTASEEVVPQLTMKR